MKWRRLTALLLAFTMVLSLTVNSYAAGDEISGGSAAVEEADSENGLTEGTEQGEPEVGETPAEEGESGNVENGEKGEGALEEGPIAPASAEENQEPDGDGEGEGLRGGDRSAAVAKIGGEEYNSLTAAVAAAQAGDTIVLVADDTSLSDGSELVVNKAITITGEVDGDGKPLYTIYGMSTNAGYNDILVKATSGTVTISNVKIANFGNEESTASGHAPIWVSNDNTAKVVIDNVDISGINRTAINICNGEFEIKNSRIDCNKSTDYGSVMTKGIEVHHAATGSITGTTITGANNTYGDWTTAGIEVFGSGIVTVSNCTITGPKCGVAISDVVKDSDTNDPGSAKVTINNCTINVEKGAVWTTGAGSEIYINDGTYSGFVAVWEGYIEINSGTFDGDIYSSESSTIYINGGTVNGEIEADDDGEVTINGGSINNKIIASENGTIEINPELFTA